MSDKVRFASPPPGEDVVYLKRKKSLSLEQLVVIRKWLRESYRSCQSSGDKAGMAEILSVGLEISRTIDHITCRDGIFAKRIEW